MKLILSLLASSVCAQLFEDAAPPLNPPAPGNPWITPTNPPPASPYIAPTEAKYDYAKALHISQIWFEIQRSGEIKPEEQRLGWRASSCLNCTGKFGEDLSGAWYEAANTMKWGLPLAWTVQNLATGILFFKEGFKATNELDQALKTVRSGVDYLSNCHVNAETFVGQLGLSQVGDQDGDEVDFKYYLAPEYYEQYMKPEWQHPALYLTPAFPSGEISGQSSAAMAVGALIFKESDRKYADSLIVHAKVSQFVLTLQAWYEFGVKYPASYNNEETRTNVLDDWFTAAGWYPSTSVYDDLCLAAIYLYKYTNEQRYMTEALDHYTKAENSFYSSSWDAQGPLINTLLFEITKEEKYLQVFKYFSDERLPGGNIPFTPYGLSWGGAWGTFAHAMSGSNQMLYMAKLLGKDDPYSKRMTTFAISQANYILGDTGYVWMTGFAEPDQPQPFRLNHISSFNPYDDEALNNNKTLTDDWGNSDFLNNLTPNRRICYGGIPSGPDQTDTYQDDHRMYQYSEPTQDYTAPAVGVFAALVEFYGTENATPFSDCTLDLGWDAPGRIPGATKKPEYPADDCYHTCNREKGAVCRAESSQSSVGNDVVEVDTSGASSVRYASVVLGMIVLALV